MKKEKSLILLLVVFTLMALLYYVSTEDIIFTVLLFVGSVVYSIFFVRKRILSTNNYSERVENCNTFINSLVVSLSIRNNLTDSVLNILDGLPESLRKELEIYRNDDPIELLKNLREYFRLDIYAVFTETVILYSEQGGDPLTMFSEILDNSRSLLEKDNEIKNEGKKTFTATSILWGLALLVLVVCRFSISEIYDRLLGQTLFSIMVFIVYVMCLASYHLFIIKVTRSKEKENAKRT